MRWLGLVGQVVTIVAILWGQGSASAQTSPSIQILQPDKPATDTKRFALVIGNAVYKNVPQLRNSVSDASAIAKAVRKLGFETFFAQNLDRRDMNDAIGRFLQRIEPGSEVMVYYAGHGVEMQGSNYLLPTDIPALSTNQERLLRSEAVNLTDLLQDVEGRSTRVALVILDACRDNPFPRSGTRSLGSSRGLGNIVPPQGSFVIYAAGAGEQALDSLGPGDKDPNGLFTRQFLRLLNEDGLELRSMVRKLRADVREVALTRANHSQVPSYYDQMLGDFYFRPPRPGGDTGVTECDRLVDPQASSERLKSADVEKAMQACIAAVERFPSEPRLRQLLDAAQDQRAYRKAIDSRERAMADAYLALFPYGRFVEDVRQHLASLGAVPAPTPDPLQPPPQLDPKDLARVLQVELARVGCDPGTPDGAWGPASQQAMQTYNRNANTRIDAGAPTMAALADVRTRSARVCPLTCKVGYKVDGGTCVAIVCPMGQVANATGSCVTAAPTPAKRNCVTFNGTQYCD
jgi:hypothetical protein